MQSALPNHSLLLEYCTCHSGLFFLLLEQNVELHAFRISQFACNQISCWQANAQRSSKPFFASFFFAWQRLERELIPCKVCTGHSLMPHLRPLNTRNIKCHRVLDEMHHVIYVLKLYICFNVACGQTEEGQNLGRGSSKSSTAGYLHGWKNLRRARPVAPRKLLEVICGFGWGGTLIAFLHNAAIGHMGDVQTWLHCSSPSARQ